ncbi:MAG: hypothetical protein J1F11_00500 [Oscillospiraceae bacterium]|nr:hypothetical protein [Oscillospiraceae bacterium]
MELDYLKIRTDRGYMYGGDQSLFGKLSSHSGCGMIAVCDTILFLRHGEGYSPTLSEYTSFVEDVRDNDIYRHRLNLIGVPTGLIIKTLKKYTKKSFRFYGKGKFDRKGLGQLISDSILQGVPVIVRIGENGNRLPYKINFPASGNKTRTGKIRWHYITVTGLTDSETVLFSSWGGRGEMELDHLYRYFGVTGGVFLIDSLSLRTGRQ